MATVKKPQQQSAVMASLYSTTNGRLRLCVVYSIGTGKAVRITLGLSMIYFLKMDLPVMNDQLQPNIHTFVLDRQPGHIKHHTLESS